MGKLPVMSIKFLFEDKETTPSSILLSEILGDSVYFSSGNNLLKSKIKEIWNPNDVFIVFIDVTPDRQSLYKSIYKGFIRYLCENGYNNCYVIPIFCIEYYIIKLLNFCGVNNSVGRFKDISKCVLEDDAKVILKKIKSTGLVMEKLYKEYVNTQAKTCTRNTNHKSDYTYGYFYSHSCLDCEKEYCNVKKRLELMDKAVMLYTNLPVFDSNKDIEEILKKYGYNCIETCIEDVLQNQQELYNKYANIFGVVPMKVTL